jgi:hypothetical protein
MSERSHPFDLVFAGELEAKLAAIGEEAAERDVDTTNADRLGMLLSTGELLRELLPDDAPADAIQQIARLVFHCFHFHASGRQTFEIDEAVLRELLGTGFVAGPGHVAPPAPAGYVMLPRNRVWSRITEDAHAEALDGFFFVGDDILFVLGLMPGRPGFSIMEVSAADAADENVSVAELKARAEGDDFANVLPGGELQGHFAITNTAEALKLAARCFWQLTPRDG